MREAGSEPPLAKNPCADALRQPLELVGPHVRLVPLSPDHAGPLFAEAGDPRIWTYLLQGQPRTEEEMRKWIERLLNDQAAGTALPFTILHGREEATPVGMTRYMEIHREHRRLEIGGSWLPPRLWGTRVNPEAKYLLLRHAFEVEGFLRVEFKTDLRNLRSQRAMVRIGATREGVLRRHMTTQGGFQRDSVYLSILAEEWPGVRSALERRLSESDPTSSPPGA